MLRCSGGQASHQVYQGQMYFDQGHKSSACGGDQVDSHVDGQVGVDNPIQLGGGYVFAQLDVLEVVEVVVVAFAVVLVVAAEDMLEVLGRFFRETKSLCLKLMMLDNFWRPVWEQGRSGNCMKEN